jgi:hypothetical protein
MKIVLAYVDPGLGLLAWQTVVGVFVGLLFYLKKTRTWLLRVLQRAFRVTKREQPAPANLPPVPDKLRQ